MQEWIVQGSVAINDDARSGPLRVYRGSAETWLGLVDQRARDHVLSLNCVDRRMLLGTSSDDAKDSRSVIAMPGQRLLGYHDENRGHPADNERVIRDIDRVDCECRYTATGLILQIRTLTLRGELSRDDGFQADQSPWTIRISLEVPRALVPAVFALSAGDAAAVDRRFPIS